MGQIRWRPTGITDRAVECGLHSLKRIYGKRVDYRTRHWNRTSPPWLASRGAANSQRSISESPSLGMVKNAASRLDLAEPSTYSNRVVRLSISVTLPIGESPTLSKRIVKSTISPGLAWLVEATLMTRSLGFSG